MIWRHWMKLYEGRVALHPGVSMSSNKTSICLISEWGTLKKYKSHVSSKMQLCLGDPRGFLLSTHGASFGFPVRIVIHLPTQLLRHLHWNKKLLLRSLSCRPRAEALLLFKPFCCWQKVLPKHKLGLSSSLKIPFLYREKALQLTAHIFVAWQLRLQYWS